MNIRSHRCWPLIEEVGLKRLFIRVASPGRVPNDLEFIRGQLRPIIENFDEQYDFLVKASAIESLAKFRGATQAGFHPKGMELYSYGIPPATRSLTKALQEGIR